MASPFPGMDPYLEDPAVWSEFHYKFINYWQEALADVLPNDYEAAIGERVYLIEHDGPKEAYVEVLHRSDRSLVAVLELLSPANKNQPGRVEYLLKRNAIVHQQIHLVELDLLLGGHRLPMSKPLPAGDCYYLISRWEPRPDCQVYAWSLRQPLPRLPVPLRAADNDVVVDYAGVFATAYERGRFGRRVRYGLPCPAPLGPSDKAWAESLATE